MKKRSDEDWRLLFKQHDESGLTAAAFCRNNQLCSKYFSKRKRDLNWPIAKPNEPQFVRVKTPTKNQTDTSVCLICHSIRLEVPMSVEPVWLAQLVQALR